MIEFKTALFAKLFIMSRFHSLYRLSFLRRAALCALLLSCVLPYIADSLSLQQHLMRRAALQSIIRENRAQKKDRATAEAIQIQNVFATLYDGGENDRRTQSIAKFIAPRTLLGYVGDNKIPTHRYYLMQYSLAPRVLIASSQPRLILVEFFSPARYRAAQRDRVLERWVEEHSHASLARWHPGNDLYRVVTKREALVLVRDFGNGLMLFRHPQKTTSKILP